MRLKPISPSELTAEQRPLFEQIKAQTDAHMHGFVKAQKDGALLGPFNPMVHFPQFGSAAWGVNVALSEHTTLPKPVHELAILVTGARFSARYEIYAHEAVAEQAGLSKAKIASLASGGRPSDLTESEAVAFDVASALTRGAQLPASTYQAAVAAFGEQGTAELIYLVGFYCLICVLLNGYDSGTPESEDDTK